MHPDVHLILTFFKTLRLFWQSNSTETKFSLKKLFMHMVH